MALSENIRRNFIVISGGPGPYADDPDHDKVWWNYVQSIVECNKGGKLRLESEESILWFIYKPAYVDRWESDKKSDKDWIQRGVREILKGGWNSYTDKLAWRARTMKSVKRLIWFNDASDFWRKLYMIDDYSISRLWYFGHSSSSALYLRYPYSQREQIVCVDREKFCKKFQTYFSYMPGHSCRFYGCHTANFAQKWAKMFRVYAEGAAQKIHYKDYLDLKRLGGPSWQVYDTDGKCIKRGRS